MYNHEEIYSLLQEEKWAQLFNSFFQSKNLLKTDELLSKAFETSLTMIINKAIERYTSPDFIDSLHKLLLMHGGNFISLNNEQEEIITLAYINGRKNDLQICIDYAKKYPNHELSKQIIEEYQLINHNKINHSQELHLDITVNDISGTLNDFRKTIFNSTQEIEFYIALKRVFPTYFVYPNIALSNIFDFEKIQVHLDTQEQNFFLKSSVDFVIFEPLKNYLPIFFIELDSSIHDNAKQLKKDELKNKIFGLSGQKLYRIRKRDTFISEYEFEKLLREVRSFE